MYQNELLEKLEARDAAIRADEAAKWASLKAWADKYYELHFKENDLEWMPEDENLNDQLSDQFEDIYKRLTQ
jgi:hypothetical protein